jgi:hypothetical protein
LGGTGSSGTPQVISSNSIICLDQYLCHGKLCYLK